MINKILIKNFRSIKSQEFKNIANTLVFVGENNSGKSTVLNALRTFFNVENSISENDIRHGCGYFEISLFKNITDNFLFDIEMNMRTANSPLFKSFLKEFRKSNPNRILYTKVYYKLFKSFIQSIYFGGANIQIMGLKLKVDKSSLRKDYTIISSSNKPLTGIKLGMTDPLIKAFLPSVASVDDERKFFEEVGGELKSISSSVFSLFVKGLSQDSNNLSIASILDKKAVDLSITDLNNLLNIKLNSESNKFLKRVNNTFKKYTKSDLEIHWNFNDKLESRIDFKSNFTNDSYEPIDFMSTGSGTRSIYLISLLQSYMEMSKESNDKSVIFLIEEPELYLYPKLEADMADILVGISKNNQVFISTHSASLAHNFKKDSIYLTEMDLVNNSPVSKYSLLNDVSQLMEILGFNSYPFLNKDYVVIVEGPGDIKKYMHIFSVLGYDIEKIAFIRLGGVANVKLSIDLQFIQMSELSNKFFIIIDSDGRNYQNSKKYYTGHFSTNTGLSKRELKDLMNNRFYITEKSTMIETLTFCESNMVLQGNELSLKLENFINNHHYLITDSLDKKIAEKVLHSSQKDEIMEILHSRDVTSILRVLKEIVITKKLLRLFRSEVCLFKTVDELEVQELCYHIPILKSKLDSFMLPEIV